MTILVTFVVWSCLATTGAFVVYDCLSTNTTYAAVDLHSPQPCDHVPYRYQPPENVRVQIVQTAAARPVKAYHCRVTVTKMVTRCGVQHHSYGTHYPVIDRVLDLTPDECRKATQSLVLNIEGKMVPVRIGIPTTLSWIASGGIDSDGYCLWGTFAVDGVGYTKHYLRIVAKVNIGYVAGEVDPLTNTVYFKNLLRANYKDGVLRDAMAGTIVWHPEEPVCADTVSELYHGNASIIRQVDHTQPRGRAGDIILLANQTTDQYAGMVLKEVSNLCGARVFSTQLERIGVVVMTRHDRPIPHASFKARFDTKLTSVTSQLGYIHITASRSTEERFQSVWRHLCNTERKWAATKLQQMASTQNKYAVLDTHGSGHQVVRAGAVAYIAKCTPREAVLHPYPNCTEEIPVKLINPDEGTDTTTSPATDDKDQIRFADPLTFILKPFPVMRPCDSVTPVRWRIGDAWVCSTPSTIPCSAPQQLALEANRVRAEEAMYDFTHGLGSDIYTAAQKTAHLMFEKIESSREAVLTDLTTNAVYTSTDSTLGFAFGDASLQYLTLRVGAALLPLYQYLGPFWVTLSTAILVIVVIKTVLDVAGRAYLIFEARGCGWYIFAALWQTAFALISLPWRFAGHVSGLVTGQRVPGTGDPARPGGASRRHDDDDDDDDPNGDDKPPPQHRPLLDRFSDDEDDIPSPRTWGQAPRGGRSASAPPERQTWMRMGHLAGRGPQGILRTGPKRERPYRGLSMEVATEARKNNLYDRLVGRTGPRTRAPPPPPPDSTTTASAPEMNPTPPGGSPRSQHSAPVGSGLDTNNVADASAAAALDCAAS